MGPVRLQFAGTAEITERDETAHRLVANAASAEKGRGQAAMVITATLPAKARGTRVGVTQDLQLAGAAAQYGRGMISDVTTVLMRDFSANLAAAIAARERGDDPAAATSRRGGQRPGHRAGRSPDGADAGVPPVLRPLPGAGLTGPRAS